MKKVLIVGCKGQLGTHLIETLERKYELVPLSHQAISIEDYENVELQLTEHKPDIVINTAAYHHVDECETNPDGSFMVNAIGARNLAAVCNQLNAALVHISTDYVFDGRDMPEEGYTEFEKTNPLNVYAKSKLAGEEFIKSISSRFFIVRTSWLFGAIDRAESNRNFVLKIINLLNTKKSLKIVNDQVGTPTYTLDLANKISELISTKKYGLYHIANSGRASWYDLAVEIKALCNSTTKVEPCTSDNYKTKAIRPKFSVLRNYMLKLNGFEEMPHWKDSLERYLLNLRSKQLIE